VTEGVDVARAVQTARADEIYNLASQSRPGESWSRAAETLMVNGFAALRLFEAVRHHSPRSRVYQASSSEMFGQPTVERQDEETKFNPVNPYAAAKVYAHQMAQIYRKSYGLHICNGILFNHESERRSLHFLTQKVAYGTACAALGILNSPERNERGRPIVQDGKLALGNIQIARDWGYAPDFVRAMWLILQQQEPADFVIGTGTLKTIRHMCEVSYQSVGRNWQDHVVSDPQLARPVETGKIVADPSKARRVLGWKPSISFDEMIERMVKAQIHRLERVHRGKL
jgi:GDPmannose 4,6-dehydratase